MPDRPIGYDNRSGRPIDAHRHRDGVGNRYSDRLPPEWLIPTHSVR
jgi:hypothetical protein